MEYRITDNNKCGVIGYGSWATALVHTLENNKKEVWWHVTNEEILESLNEEGHNAKYLSDIDFDMNLIHATSDINEVIRECEIILVAAPSAFLKKILSNITESLENKFILSATKGIIQDDFVTITEYFSQCFGIRYSNLGVISGPSHAEEVSRDKLSYLTVACKDRENAELIGQMFNTKSVNISYSDDIYGIEYAGILKNIYALAVGLAYGLGYGDLLVTAYSSFSRNRRLGQLIGHGCTVKSALNEMTMVAEGYYASACIKKINETHNISLPIADMVYDILYCRANPRKSMLALAKLL